VYSRRETGMLGERSVLMPVNPIIEIFDGIGVGTTR